MLGLCACGVIYGCSLETKNPEISLGICASGWAWI